MVTVRTAVKAGNKVNASPRKFSGDDSIVVGKHAWFDPDITLDTNTRMGIIHTSPGAIFMHKMRDVITSAPESVKVWVLNYERGGMQAS